MAGLWYRLAGQFQAPAASGLRARIHLAGVPDVADRSNDNEPHSPAAPALPDAHGHGALLLVESLIHVLIEKSVISLADGLEIVSTAVEVSRETADARGEPGGPDLEATTLLLSISNSLKSDVTPV